MYLYVHKADKEGTHKIGEEKELALFFLDIRVIMNRIKIKPAYEPSEKSVGFRILVDRLWPRGIKKEDAHVDVWLKDIAPSTALRKWFNHDAEKWDKFRNKYKTELKQSQTLEELLTFIRQHKTVTLLCAAKDIQHNQALALKEFLEQNIKTESL